MKGELAVFVAQPLTSTFLGSRIGQLMRTNCSPFTEATSFRSIDLVASHEWKTS